MGYFWAMMSVLLVSFAQLTMKWAMVTLPLVSHPDELMTALLIFSPGAVALVTGLLAYVCSMACWFMALRRVALSKAYPLLSLSYVLVWAAAIWLPWLHEKFSMGKLVGVGVIFAGLLLVCLPDRKP
ncbi:MAG TPA: 4-amino-4-deoxy-L-arabinose-phosphoundecaprenol flippase subunit ArnF [Buttiauxella sp.]|uniref:4-amino-4-deoxy-L-arabinose-phosphoundecaprenol flippase subunit ArnF n=1 Tax=Buttiauxella sp. TaxID=1972222 RepID=UPI002B47A257|nr:4-amino-4-deoxy-L-arabinose-phosphoundecaprenol flippase subunit ArnF [Buttiauxella sp.]HKM95751.1 4-amino-4-deoxy-L-arabinose-phosphoundecaprenol flippase subunit ArnF [Buttiauxella sp.]